MSGAEPEVLEWMRRGTDALLSTMQSLDDEAFAEPLELPSWTRAHLLAHVAANAEALRRLARWAATGVPTPMYSSAEQRSAEIESGSRLPPRAIRSWVESSAAQLAADLSELTPDQWGVMVVTGTGRKLPATAIPWLRTREVWIHAVDLRSGIDIRDLPSGLLIALADDIAGQRGTRQGHPGLTIRAEDVDLSWTIGDGGPLVRADLADLVAWLAGRGTNSPDLPDLPPWL